MSRANFLNPQVWLLLGAALLVLAVVFGSAAYAPWFGKVPSGLVRFISAGALVAIGFSVEKNYVGRLTTVANVMALNIYFYGLTLHPLLGAYLNLGLILAAAGFFAYNMEQSLGGTFYIINWAYSSIVVGGILFLSLVS